MNRCVHINGVLMWFNSLVLVKLIMLLIRDSFEESAHIKVTETFLYLFQLR